MGAASKEKSQRRQKIIKIVLTKYNTTKEVTELKFRDHPKNMGGIQMEYVYAAMLLHKAGKEITEGAVKKILEAAGVHADDARVKSLIAALEGVNIDEAVKKAAAVPAAAPAAAGEAKAAPKGDTKKKEEESKKGEEQAAAGLGALFG